MGRYIFILVMVMALWNTIIIKPLKIFTVFLHELGHSFMAFVFGYGINSFRVNLNESGHTIVQSKGWFSSFMIANGGYVGSVLFALLILYLKRTFFKNYLLGTIAILFLSVSIKFAGFSFTLVYSIAFTAVVLLIYMLHNEKVTEWAIDILGIASVAYAIYDTFVDTILLSVNNYFHVMRSWNTKNVTDAVVLANMTHIPAIVWGIIWLAISLFAVYASLIKSPAAPRRRR